MLINVGADFGKSLESSEIAIELVDILNKIDKDDYILNLICLLLGSNKVESEGGSKGNNERHNKNYNFSKQVNTLL